MKLIVQPRDGLSSLVSAIRLAKKEIDIVIFRFDRIELQEALENAVKRGVKLRTLIAHTNRGGDKNLRKLEQKMLDVGATVSRTGDEFIRYHGKFMVIDRKVLWLMGFNFTALDINGSRSFGLVSRHRSEVQQALNLFEADRSRQPYAPAGNRLVVSPENARTLLSEFVHKAKRQLLIYDPKVSDSAIAKVLKDRLKSDVDIRIIGKVGKPARDIPHEKYPGKRMHVRAIVRDGRDVFIGSQSLRKLELDKRREVGIIVSNTVIARELAAVFEEDWALTDSGKRGERQKEKPETDDERQSHLQAV